MRPGRAVEAFPTRSGQARHVGLSLPPL